MSDLQYVRVGDVVRRLDTGEALTVTVVSRHGWRIVYEQGSGDSVRYELLDDRWVETDRVRGGGPDAAA